MEELLQRKGWRKFPKRKVEAQRKKMWEVERNGEV